MKYEKTTRHDTLYTDPGDGHADVEHTDNGQLISGVWKWDFPAVACTLICQL